MNSILTKNIDFVKILFFILTFLICLLFNGCEKEVTTSPPMEPVPVGAVKISSDPPGAKIYEDGRFSGKYTPDSLNWLEEKIYKFTLKKELYCDTSFHIEIAEDEKKEIFVDYYSNQRMYGKISFTSVPDSAAVFLNDELLEELTPCRSENLIPGDYLVRYKKNNCREDSLLITVKSNEVFDAHINLTDTSVWVDYRTKNSGISLDHVACVAVDRNNVIWAGTTEGLDRFDGTRWTNYSISNSPLLDNSIKGLDVDKDNNLWISTLAGLYKLYGANWEIFTKGNDAKLPDDAIEDVAFDRDGRVYVATKRGLAVSTSNREWYTIKDSVAGLTLNNMWCTGVEFDSDDNLWLVTYGNGIFKKTAEGWEGYFNYLSYDPPMTEVFFNCVAADQNTVWFGHRIVRNFHAYMGLSCFTNGYFKKGNFRVFDGVNIFDISIKNNTEKWINTDIGLYVFDQYASRTVYTAASSGMTTSRTRGAAFDNNGNIWIATWGAGLYKFKRGY